MQKRLAVANISDLSPDAFEYLLFASPPHDPAAHRHGARLGLLHGRARAVTRTLVVTNDFPPRPGGIQSFVHGARRLPPAGLGRRLRPRLARAATSFDAAQPYPVVRHPTVAAAADARVARRAAACSREYECDSVRVRRGGAAGPARARRCAAAGRRARRRAHPRPRGRLGGAARAPGAAARGSASDADVVTYLGEYTRARLAPALDRRRELAQLRARRRPDRVPPGRRRRGGARALGLGGPAGGRSASRGWCRARARTRSLRAWPRVRARVPDAALLLVGGGPYRADAGAAGRASGLARRTSCSPARCRGRRCPATTPPATCSPCRAAPAGAGSTSRGSASSTWRPPPAGCPWWRARPAAPRTRCWQGETG